jgi:altronate dehydratase
MNIKELMARVGGQILANKARANVGGQSVVIGVFEDGELVFTEAGKALADREDNVIDVQDKQEAAKAAAAAPKAAKTKATAKAAPAVESAPVEPEIDLGAE